VYDYNLTLAKQPAQDDYAGMKTTMPVVSFGDDRAVRSGRLMGNFRYLNPNESHAQPLRKVHHV
jgi:hypothetical protein